MTGIKIEGLGRLRDKLGRVKPSVTAGLLAGAVYLKGKIAKYPPSVTSYARTGRLGQGWTTGKVNDLTYKVGNIVPYGIYVQGKAQRTFHKAHGWQTTDDAISKYSEAVNKLIKKAIDKGLSGR